MNFNCTIQELKLYCIIEIVFVPEKFQLHHTGIKTLLTTKKKIFRDGNFNCTIQELKLVQFLELSWTLEHFNCTIQELKLKDIEG